MAEGLLRKKALRSCPYLGAALALLRSFLTRGCLFLPQWTDVDGDFASLQGTSFNVSLSRHTWKGVVLSPLLLLVA